MTESARSHTAAVVGGLAVSFIAALGAWGAGRLGTLVSPLLVAIVLGVVAGNAVPCHLAGLKPGLDLAGKRLLRIGIVLLGLQLSLGEIAALGWRVVAVAAAVVVIGVPLGVLIGQRMGLTPTQSILTACGFSICGAAAVAATDGVVDADEREVATSVALVVVCGTVMIPLTAALSGIGLSDFATGVFAGGAIHEVAQVVAAGGVVGGTVLATAVVVKLTRVLMLAPVMTVLALRQRQALNSADAARNAQRPALLPLFVAGFTVAVLVRSFGHVSGAVLDVAAIIETLLLSAAMFALGTHVRWQMIRSVGSTPLVHAAACTLLVSAVALGGALLAA